MSETYEDGRFRHGEIIHYDENGRAFVRDEAGNRRPPMHSQPLKTNTDFTTYDTSEGH